MPEPETDPTFATLRSVIERADPVPPPVVAAAKASFTWRTIDSELAELVADSADNWIDDVPVADPAHPLAPVRLPTDSGTAAASGTDHPTDIVTGPGSTGAFVVTGLGTVLPYDPTHQTFGRSIRVCSGASSMTVGVTS